MNLLFIFLLLLALLGLFALLFNRLVYAQQKVSESWSGVSVQLKKRHDLIPNLIKLVNSYAIYESDLLKEITEVRQKALNKKNSISSQSMYEGLISKQLDSLFVVIENHPSLKANKNFLRLQEDLTEIEDQISAARRIYNSNVSIFNTRVKSFPSNLVANILNFKVSTFFVLDHEGEIKEMI